MRQTKSQETQGEEKKKEREGSVPLNRETVPSLDSGERLYSAAKIQI